MLSLPHFLASSCNKRPMCAYNFFFTTQRMEWVDGLKVLEEEDKGEMNEESKDN